MIAQEIIERYIFDTQTGEIRQKYTGTAFHLPACIPDGCGSIDASLVTDPQSQRVNPSTGQVGEWQPPAPSADYEWIHDDPSTGARVRRWVLTAAAAERRAKKSAAVARMAALAGKHERASREFLLGIVPTEEDRAAGAMTLQEIEDEMAALRPEVR